MRGFGVGLTLVVSLGVSGNIAQDDGKLPLFRRRTWDHDPYHNSWNQTMDCNPEIPPPPPPIHYVSVTVTKFMKPVPMTTYTRYDLMPPKYPGTVTNNAVKTNATVIVEALVSVQNILTKTWSDLGPPPMNEYNTYDTSLPKYVWNRPYTLAYDVDKPAGTITQPSVPNPSALSSDATDPQPGTRVGCPIPVGTGGSAAKYYKYKSTGGQADRKERTFYQIATEYKLYKPAVKTKHATLTEINIFSNKKPTIHWVPPAPPKPKKKKARGKKKGKPKKKSHKKKQKYMAFKSKSKLMKNTQNDQYISINTGSSSAKYANGPGYSLQYFTMDNTNTNTANLAANHPTHLKNIFSAIQKIKLDKNPTTLFNAYANNKKIPKSSHAPPPVFSYKNKSSFKPLPMTDSSRNASSAFDLVKSSSSASTTTASSIFGSETMLLTLFWLLIWPLFILK